MNKIACQGFAAPNANPKSKSVSKKRLQTQKKEISLKKIAAAIDTLNTVEFYSTKKKPVQIRILSMLLFFFVSLSTQRSNKTKTISYTPKMGHWLLYHFILLHIFLFLFFVFFILNRAVKEFVVWEKKSCSCFQLFVSIQFFHRLFETTQNHTDTEVLNKSILIIVTNE